MESNNSANNDNYKPLIKILDALKHYTGMLIIAGFSGMIFLLSLIKEEERTIALEWGITFLLVSIIFNFYLVSYVSKFAYDLMRKELDNEKIKTKILFSNLLQSIGEKLFFLSIVYLFSHFHLFYLSLLCILYLIIFIIKDLIGDIVEYNERKKKKKKKHRYLIAYITVRGALLLLIILSELLFLKNYSVLIST